MASKALRVNLSDLAAKGAKPLGFLLSLALPADIDERWLADFAEGLRSDAVLYGCPLFGGDTDRTPGPMTVSDRHVRQRAGRHHGAPRRRQARRPRLRQRHDRRCRARACRAQGQDGAERGAAPDLLARYLLPQPRNALAEAVRKHASAAMDVSDGLAGDFAKLCRVSQVGADIAVERVPLSGAAKAVLAAEPAMRETALTGGDDYEIVCTVPPAKADGFRAAAQAANVMVTEIGEIEAGEGARFLAATARPLAFKHASFSHF